jgi:hypothetical protein
VCTTSLGFNKYLLNKERDWNKGALCTLPFLPFSYLLPSSSSPVAWDEVAPDFVAPWLCDLLTGALDKVLNASLPQFP